MCCQRTYSVPLAGVAAPLPEERTAQSFAVPSGDARIAIEEVQSGAEVGPDVPHTPSSRRSKVLGGSAAVLFLAQSCSLGALSVMHFNESAAAPPEIRVEVSTPPTADPFRLRFRRMDGGWCSRH